MQFEEQLYLGLVVTAFTGFVVVLMSLMFADQRYGRKQRQRRRPF